jgi:hypothetical protein
MGLAAGIASIVRADTTSYWLLLSYCPRFTGVLQQQRCTYPSYRFSAALQIMARLCYFRFLHFQDYAKSQHTASIIARARMWLEVLSSSGFGQRGLNHYSAAWSYRTKVKKMMSHPSKSSRSFGGFPPDPPLVLPNSPWSTGLHALRRLSASSARTHFKGISGRVAQGSGPAARRPATTRRATSSAPAPSRSRSR